MQHLIQPLVVGWGWGDAREFDSGSDFHDFHEWLGTDDPSALLAVPAAITFQRDRDWATVQARCHELAITAVERGAKVPGVDRVHANGRFAQMGLLEVGRGIEQSPSASAILQSRLYEEFRIEVPVISWRDPLGDNRVFVRISIQAYNTDADVDALIGALSAIAPTLTTSARRC